MDNTSSAGPLAAQTPTTNLNTALYLRCSDCQETCFKAKTVVRHMNERGHNSACPLCACELNVHGQKATRTHEDHIRSCNGPVMTCQNCKSDMYSNDYHAHIESVHKSEEILCPLGCGKAFASLTYYNRLRGSKHKCERRNTGTSNPRRQAVEPPPPPPSPHIL